MTGEQVEKQEEQGSMCRMIEESLVPQLDQDEAGGSYMKINS